MTHITTARLGRRARRTTAAGLLAACAFAGFAAGGASPAHAISPCTNPNPRLVPSWCWKIPGTKVVGKNAETVFPRTHITFNRTH